MANNSSLINYFVPEIITANDYYPGGMMMPGRKFNGGYRYGFNGKENDNEVKGEGNQQDYGLRPYDVRLGRLISVDPLAKKYPWYTPYQFAGNNPIKNIDYLGGQPKDRAGQYQFDMMGNRPKNVAYGDDIIMNDPKLGYLNVRTVYDQTTKQVWFIASHSSNPSQMYYYEAKDGNHQALHVERNKGSKGMYAITGGQFTPYVTPEQYDDMMRAKVANEFVDGFSTAIFLGGLAGAAAPIMPAITPYAANYGTQVATASFSSRVVASVADAGVQYVGNTLEFGFGKENFNKINLSSSALAFINPTSILTTGIGGNFLRFTGEDKFKKAVGGSEFNFKTAALSSVIDIGGGGLGGKVENKFSSAGFKKLAAQSFGEVSGNSAAAPLNVIAEEATKKKPNE